jgi:hypothetical protein
MFVTSARPGNSEIVQALLKGEGVWVSVILGNLRFQPALPTRTLGHARDTKSG